MFSAIERVIAWVTDYTELNTSLFVPENAAELDSFCVCERTGGVVDYPHDTPEFTVSVWAKDAAKAEAQIMNLAAAIKLDSPVDGENIIALVGLPNVVHLGLDEIGHDIWSMSFSLKVNLID